MQTRAGDYEKREEGRGGDDGGERDREVGRDGTSKEIRKREDGCGEWAGQSSITRFSQWSYMFVHHVDPQVHFKGRRTVSTTMADHPLVRTSEPSAVKFERPS